MRNHTCYLIILIVSLLHITVVAQPVREITGRITGANETPLNAATVQIKNAGSGTSADYNGFFKIAAPANSVLIVSAVGYETKELNIGSQTFVAVELSADIRPLSDVVVTGIGVATSKRRLGISVEAISADKLPQVPSASVDQALIGKIPGAQISSVSGNPGDPVNILLRGINTVQEGTYPLILVDGVSVNATDINSLDLNSVERVEVAQGAASATIYGAQGANGVIQIFTKRGKKGPVAINFSTGYSFNQFLNNGNVHKAELHSFLTDANNNIVDVNTGMPLAYTDVGTIEGLSYAYGGPTRNGILDTRNIANKPYNANLTYYDHFKQIFQTGTTINNSLSFSGGSDKTDFYLSVSNNHSVSPILKSGAVERSNLTGNVGMQLFRGFKIRSITQLIYTRNTLYPSLGAQGTKSSLGQAGGVLGILQAAPFFDMTRKLADGTYPFYLPADFVSVNATNPYYLLEYTKNIDNKIDILQSFDANYNVNKFLELDAKYGINYQTRSAQSTYFNQSQNLNSIYYDPNYIGIYAPDNTGEIDKTGIDITTSNFLGTAYIKTDFENDFHVKLPVRTSTQLSFDYRKNSYKRSLVYGVGLPLAPPVNLTATSSQVVLDDYVEPFVTYGYLVNQKIDFSDFGGITAGFRSDWSSAFGAGSKPFTFPHFDGHLLLTSFFKNTKLTNVLPYFKVRAAYGKAGIQPGPFDRYQTLEQHNLGDALVYTIPATTNNPDLQVEVSSEFETGTDFTVNTNKNGTWLSAINGSFSFWKRKSGNVIYTVSVAPSNGATGQLTNAIDMSSNGIQFSLNIPVYNSRNLKWDLTTNFGHQTSVIDNLNGGSDIILVSGAGKTALVLTPGQKIGQLFGYKALTSLDFTRQDGTRYIPKADEDLYTIVDGRVVLKSTKQIQFTNEKYPLGDPNPKFNASFINSLSYKDFLILSFQLDWIYGSHLYNQTKEWIYRDGISGDFTRPVTIEGEKGAFTAYWSSPYYNLFGSKSGAGNNATKDYFYEDASFLRLRNISLAFDVTRIVKAPYLHKCQLVLSGRNILTVTKYTGLDPEISSGGVNSAFDRGVDNNTMPNTKSYQVGLNIGF